MTAREVALECALRNLLTANHANAHRLREAALEALVDGTESSARRTARMLAQDLLSIGIPAGSSEASSADVVGRLEDRWTALLMGPSQ